MTMKTFNLFLLMSLLFCSSMTWSQSDSNPVRLRGTIVSMTDTVMTIKERSGESMNLTINANLGVQEVFPINKSEILPNAFIGSAAVTGSDGKLKALEVHVFPEASRGTGEGHRPWDLEPQSTMTNATVSQLLKNAGNVEVNVQYKGGEKTIVIDDNTPVVTYKPGDKSLLVPGASVFLMAVKKGEQFEVQRVSVGRNGFKPPM